jgi:hypothetical protein
MSKNSLTTNTASVSNVSDYIHLSYNAYDENVVYTTDKMNVSFNISFGKGKDSLVYTNEQDLKEFTKEYLVETVENDNSKHYYVAADEGPLLVKIENLNIHTRYNNNCDYALGFAVDFEEPEYLEQNKFTPFNIDRDGSMWSIPVQESIRGYSANVFYQNGKAKYQWTTSRAKNMGEELTEDEKELGIEKTTETTGLMYLTFMVLSKEKEVVQEQEITRSYNMRSGGVDRGITRSINRSITRSIIPDTVAGRVGYGHAATSSSVASTFKYANHTTRLVIPVRIRISKDSAIGDMNCSKTLKGAEVNMERKKIVVAPFLP